jgi:hypothetical protein
MDESPHVLRINCWSGPRNVSTALMYAFRERADTRVVDEPLYGAYLATSGAEHPHRDEVVARTETDADTVIDEVILGEVDRPVLFLKQMASHLTDAVDRRFLDAGPNALLIRDPAEVIASLVNQIPHPTLENVALAAQVELLHDLQRRGQDPPVIDARELLTDPPAVLTELCRRLGIPWDPAMLSWPAGPKPEDGVWAPWWYDNVHRSTGFAPYRPGDGTVPDHCRELLATCRPLYDELYELAIRAPR